VFKVTDFALILLKSNKWVELTPCHRELLAVAGRALVHEYLSLAPLADWPKYMFSAFKNITAFHLALHCE